MSGWHVVTAWAEPASGPGWSNRPLWVLWRKDGTSEYRVTAIQPDEQTPAMLTVYGVAAAAHRALLAEVRAWADDTEET